MKSKGDRYTKGWLQGHIEQLRRQLSELAIVGSCIRQTLPRDAFLQIGHPWDGIRHNYIQTYTQKLAHSRLLLMVVAQYEFFFALI